jgi:hypothetical protein
MNNKEAAVSALVSRLKIVEDQSLPNRLFNFINVVFQTEHHRSHTNLESPTATSPSKKTRTEALNIGSEQTIKDIESPIASNGR